MESLSLSLSSVPHNKLFIYCSVLPVVATWHTFQYLKHRLMPLHVDTVLKMEI
jgi:hypothetical protein